MVERISGLGLVPRLAIRSVHVQLKLAALLLDGAAAAESIGLTQLHLTE